MKKFLEPAIEVVEFAVEDIVTVSGDGGLEAGENDMGWM